MFQEFYQAITGYKISDKYYEYLPTDLFDMVQDAQDVKDFASRLEKYFETKQHIRWQYMDFREHSKRAKTSVSKYLTKEEHALIHVWYDLMSLRSRKILLGYDPSTY